MKIYEIKSDVNNFISFRFINDEDFQNADDQINNGEKVISWTRMNITPDEYDKEEIIGDYPYLLSIPLISEKCKELLEQHALDSNFQFLETFDVQSKQTFYFLNVLTAIEALDREKSVFNYFEQRLASIDTIFCKAEINYPSIFKIKLTSDRLITGRVFISESLRNIIENNNLKGFKFIEIPVG